MSQKSLKQRITQSETWNYMKNDPSFKTWRKVIVFVVGMTLLLVGIVMLVLPGPAIVVITLSLALLSTEFIWARKWFLKIKEKAVHLKEKISKSEADN